MVLTGVPVCRDWAFICENTGSRKGHREWFFGHCTGHWYKRSALEVFVSERYPSELEHRWTSYAGTGRSILGRGVLAGHGYPGPILQLRIEWLDQHVRHLDDRERRALYDLFRSRDWDKIESEIRDKVEESLY